MSAITLATLKSYLGVIGTGDDPLLQTLLDSAEQEACRFLNRENLPTLPLEYPPDSSSEGPYSEEVPSSEDPVAPDAVVAVCLLVKADYEATTPDEVAGYRKAAETKLQPYRRALGV
jgi:hypothetical protein